MKLLRDVEQRMFQQLVQLNADDGCSGWRSEEEEQRILVDAVLRSNQRAQRHVATAKVKALYESLWQNS